MQQLEKKKIPEQTVVTLEHSGTHKEIGSVYHELIGWAKKNGVRPAGSMFTIFVNQPSEYDLHTGVFEVCMPVAAAPKVDGKVRVKKLPACTVACAQVKGPYDQIPAHYTEMLAWLDAQGWELAGPPREVYLKHPDADGKGNPKDFLTEIQFPVGE